MEQKTVILDQGKQLFHDRALKTFAATPHTYLLFFYPQYNLNEENQGLHDQHRACSITSCPRLLYYVSWIVSNCVIWEEPPGCYRDNSCYHMIIIQEVKTTFPVSIIHQNIPGTGSSKVHPE